MGRPSSFSDDELFAAADAVIGRGEDPTVAALRAAMGNKGSHNTILAARARWLAARAAAEPTDGPAGNASSGREAGAEPLPPEALSEVLERGLETAAGALAVSRFVFSDALFIALIDGLPTTASRMP